MSKNDEARNITMALDSPPGARVVFAYPDNGYPSEREAAQVSLVPGHAYTVERTSIGGSHTSVRLKEKPGQVFNSVMFAPADCRPSQPPFTNVDSLGRGDHNPPIGALGDAIASLRPKSVAKRIAAQKGEPYPFEAQPASKALPRCEGDPETCRCAECRTAAHTAHLEARVAELEQFAKDATADCIKESAAKALAELRVAELEGALGNARGLLRRAVQGHMIRDLLGKFWVDDVSLWLNSKPVQSLDAARAKEKGNG